MLISIIKRMMIMTMMITRMMYDSNDNTKQVISELVSHARINFSDEHSMDVEYNWTRVLLIRSISSVSCIRLTSIRALRQFHNSRTFGTCSIPLTSLDQLTRATLNAVFWVKMAKWLWRSRAMTSLFNTSWKYPRMHIGCKFGDSIPNLWRAVTRKGQIC